MLRDDVEESAVASLLGDGHLGKTDDLTCPEALTFTKAAEVVPRVSGKVPRFHNEPMDEAYASRARYGAPDSVIDGWVTTNAGIAANALSPVSGDVCTLTGHEPVSLARYIGTDPESLAHVVSTTAPD